MISASIGYALPEIVLALFVLLSIAIGAIGKDRTAGAVSAISVGGLIIAAGLACCPTGYGAAFGGGFLSDDASAFARTAIYLMSAVGVILGDGWLKRLNSRQFEFPMLIVIAALGMGMMAAAGDLISLYVGVELQSLALYVLAAFRRDDPKASEAGLKYFVLGALSSGLLLYGASLIYGFSGSTVFADIRLATADSASPGLLFGLVFLMCGLAFKVSAAPFHMWTPDVYEGAPTPIVGFFTAAPKLAAMVLFARVLMQGFPESVEQWRQVLVIIALVSVAVGAFAGLVQSNLKRLLAYSSIANVGYALVGLSAGTVEGAQSIFLFMALYMVDATGFFAAMTALSKGGKPMERISDFAGLSRTRPGLAIVITALSVSVMGIPPFAGFFGKYFVFKAAIDAGLAPVAVAALVGSVVAAYYYLRLIRTMWFDAPQGEVDAPPVDARLIAGACAAFSFPVAMIALVWLEPAAMRAAQSFGG